jgi:CRP/FNR family cyclic AMP-dependent transcriptional regulator
MSMALTTGERAELLARVELFAALGARERASVADRAVDVTFEAGRAIVRQGEIGTGLFVLVSGAARVVRDGVVIARLGPGDFFGELSVLDREPRIASVIADEPTLCVALASWELDRLLEAQPALAVALLRGVTHRLRVVSADHRH